MGRKYSVSTLSWINMCMVCALYSAKGMNFYTNVCIKPRKVNDWLDIKTDTLDLRCVSPFSEGRVSGIRRVVTEGGKKERKRKKWMLIRIHLLLHDLIRIHFKYVNHRLYHDIQFNIGTKKTVAQFSKVNGICVRYRLTLKPLYLLSRYILQIEF